MEYENTRNARQILRELFTTAVIGTVLDIKENFGIGGLAEIIQTYWHKDLKDDYLASCSIEELLTYSVQLFTSIDIPFLQF